MAKTIYVLYPAYNADSYHEPLAASEDYQKLVDYLKEGYEADIDDEDSNYSIEQVTVL